MANKSIIIDGIELRLVPRESTDGSLFYVSGTLHDAVGCRVYPDGKVVWVKATTTTTANSKIKYNANRRQRYLQFKHALGETNLLVSHAVFLAWSENSVIPTSWQIDHLNGITTDNCINNLEAVIASENWRRRSVAFQLKKAGLDVKKMPYRLLHNFYKDDGKLHDRIRVARVIFGDKLNLDKNTQQ